MTRLSVVETFLNSLSVDSRAECRKNILAARTSRQAFKELENLGFSGSYDAVVNFRNSNFSNLPNDTLEERANRIVQVCSTENLRNDPVRRATDLAKELEALCYRFSALLHDHSWVAEGEKLSNRDAFRFLQILPSLSRVCIASTIELHRIRTQMSEKAIALGIIHELSEDWRKAFSAESPELLNIFESVAAITRSRLELDRQTLLEQAMEDSGNPPLAPEN
jgi:hypothetical protein